MVFRKAHFWGAFLGMCLSLFSFNLTAAESLPVEKEYALGQRMFKDLTDDANLSVGYVFYGRAAAKEHVDALGAQGLCELLGLGTTFKPVEGMEKLQSAVDKGSAKAAFNLAVLASDQIGLELDKNGFEKLLKKASEKGLPQAQYFYGQYLAESAKPPRYSDAAKWMTKASSSGDLRATAYLGFLHLKGSGVAKDTEKGMALLKQAEASGLYHSWHLRGEAYLSGFGVKKDVGAAVAQLLKSVDLGCRRSEMLLQVLPGADSKVDQSRLTSALKKEAVSGDRIAQHFYGVALAGAEKGKGRYDKAAKVFTESVDKDWLPAHSALADLYLVGMGVEQDPKKALELLVNAAKEGNVDAEYKLGFLLHRDESSPENQRRGFESVRNAALKGHRQAQRLLSLMLANGVGTTRRLTEALAWANIALAGTPDLEKAQQVLKPAMTPESIAQAEQNEQAFRIRLRREKEVSGSGSLVW